jgi:hypothetical protein
MSRVTSCGSVEQIRTDFNALRQDVARLWAAVFAICAGLDEDNGTIGTDYDSKRAPADGSDISAGDITTAKGEMSSTDMASE